MRRWWGSLGLLLLAVGLLLGTAGRVVEVDVSRTGYDDAEVLGETVLRPGTLVFRIDADEGGTFDDSIPPGSFVDLVSEGWAPVSSAVVELATQRRTLAFVQADESGVIEQRLGIPEDVELGRHTLYVVGVDSDGEPREVAVGIRVAFPLEGPGLVFPLGVALGALVALVLLALLVTRRRRHARVEEAEPAGVS